MGCIALIIGGLLGGLLRYFVGLMMPSPDAFSLGTLFINLSGAFVLGIFQRSAEDRHIPPWVRMGFATGLIGSYTTMSTFCLETDRLAGAHLGLAALFGLICMIGGPLCAYLGDGLYATVARRRAQSPVEETAL